MQDRQFSRRRIIAGAAAGVGTLALGSRGNTPPLGLLSPAAARPPRAESAVGQQARGALDSHARSIRFRDRIGIADFSRHSREARFHIVDLGSGKTESFLVAHGLGSDPGHTGWLQRFSNVDGSSATSRGTYVTADLYIGSHGRSQRLIGLDPSNSNALSRAIVIHGAWYVDPDMIRDHGKLGRSNGCLAFDPKRLDVVMARLGPGRMIYADKV